MLLARTIKGLYLKISHVKTLICIVVFFPPQRYTDLSDAQLSLRRNCLGFSLFQRWQDFYNTSCDDVTYRSELVSFSCPSATVLAYKELSTGSLVSVERRASQQVPYQFKMKLYQQFSLLVIIVVLFSAGKLHCKPYFKPNRFHLGMFSQL